MSIGNRRRLVSTASISDTAAQMERTPIDSAPQEEDLNARSHPTLSRQLVVLLAVQATLSLLLSAALLGDLVNVEERWVAFVASELLGGPQLPVTLYVYSDYEAGKLLTAGWLAPCIWLLGDKLISLRLAGALLGMLTLALAVIAARAISGERSGWWAGLLLVVAPAGYQLSRLLTLGDTTQAPLPIMIALCCYLWLRERREARRSILPAAAAFGMSIGLGVCATLASAPALCALLLVAWSEQRQCRAAWPPFLAGVTAGSSLLWVNFLLYGVNPLAVRGRSIAEAIQPLGLLSEPTQLAHHLIEFTLLCLRPQSQPPDPALWALLWWGGLLIAMIRLVRREHGALAGTLLACLPGRTPVAPLRAGLPALMLLAHAIAYLVTSYDSGNLLMAVVPLAALAASGSSRDAPSESAPVRCMLCGAAIPLVWILGCQLPLAQPIWAAPTGASAAWRAGVRLRLERRSRPDDPQLIEELLAKQGATLEVAEVRGMGRQLGLAGASDTIKRCAARLDLAREQSLLAGYGAGLAWRTPLDAAGSQQLGHELAEAGDAGCAHAAGHAMLLHHGGVALDLLPQVCQRLHEYRRADLSEAFLRGSGEGLGWRVWHAPARLAGYDPHPLLARGLSRSLRAITADKRIRRARLEATPQAWRALMPDHLQGPR